MTKDDIIRMACKTGLVIDGNNSGDDDLFAFANLIAAHEREACAKAAEKLGVYPELNVYNGGPDWYKHGKAIATAIRARGTT